MAKRVWDATDQEAANQGKAIQDMNRNFGGLRPSVGQAVGGRHTTRARNRRTAVANGRRTETFGELGVIY